MNEEDHNSHLFRKRHSAAHCLAEVVLSEFPDAKVAFGPPIENGFYYDFDLPRTLTDADLKAFEKKLKKRLSRGGAFVYEVLEPEEAYKRFADQPYKLELLDSMVEGSDEYGNKSDETVISTYKHGEFEDLCRGPHVKDLSEINPKGLKLTRVSGAYWKGDETRPMLQRIYAVLFDTNEELKHYLWQQEEALKRDHRRIGEQLDLFAFSDQVGRGLPLWLPNGMIIRDELERWAKEVEHQWGYSRISTPHITKSDLYYTSGHLPYYQEDLYPPFTIDDDEYYLRPMNCPHSHMAYKARPHSYRELPLRYAEYGTVYRYERSGQLHGMMRVRGFTQNDAHIYCSKEQAQEEFLNAMKLHEFYYKSLGIEDFYMVLALKDEGEASAKYHGDAQMWADAEAITRGAMEQSGIDYIEEAGGAAHYGPKVDFIIRAVTGKEFAASTNQVDLYMPERFDLSFTNAKGEAEQPVIIHRAPLGSHERFIAYLIEHYAGAFPVWLSPTQVQLIPITQEQNTYCSEVAAKLEQIGARVDIDNSDDRMQAKIRKASKRKIPYQLIIGAKEMSDGSVSVRLRTGEDVGSMSVTQFVDLAEQKITDRSLALLAGTS